MLISDAVFSFAALDSDSSSKVQLLDGLNLIELNANNIDVHHGVDGAGSFQIPWDKIEHKEVEGVSKL